MAKRSKKKIKIKKRSSKRLKKRKSSLIKNKSKKNENNNDLIIKTKSEWVKKALINKTGYEKKYKKSIKSNEDFWKKEGKRITWIKPYKKIKNVKYSKDEVLYKMV